LVSSLTVLGFRRSESGDYEAALAADQEAVAILRRLAAAEPDVYLPSLARSLRLASLDLSDLERYQDALPAIQDAVDIQERLAADSPDEHNDTLRQAHDTMADVLDALGRTDKADTPGH
jgi:tetratricopeptide (TPR) repeat protein